MPSTVVDKNIKYTVTIQGPQMLGEDTLRNLFMACEAFNEYLKLKFVRFEPHPSDLDPMTFRFRWKTFDDRTWTQKFKKIGGSWYMDFSVSDLFRRGELNPPLNINVREQILALVDNYGVGSVEIVW